MRLLCHIGLTLASLSLLACIRAKVIPADKFAEVYADMFLADQKVRSDAELTRIADTTLFYEPVLAKYGYDREDYLKSVGHYMEDPERFAKVFEASRNILDARVIELRAVLRREEKADSIRKAIEAMTFRRAPVYFGIRNDSLRIDTVNVNRDSSGLFVVDAVLPDTIFTGPSFITLSQLDSVRNIESAYRESSPASLNLLRTAPDGKIRMLKDGILRRK